MVVPNRLYTVELWAGVHRGDEVGPAKVGGVEGAFWVEPQFELGFPPEDATFRADWDVDEAGVARLEKVILTVRVA